MLLLIFLIVGGGCMKIKIVGGVGEKKSNNKKQWYFQDRIYSIFGLAPTLTANFSNSILILEDREELDE